jgi:hypothetical protein
VLQHFFVEPRNLNSGVEKSNAGAPRLPPAPTASAGSGRCARLLVWGGDVRKMEDGAGKRKSAKRQKEKSKSGGGQKHGRKTVFWLGASVFFFLGWRQAPQDRRRLTFFWGWAEMRRSRLWPLKVVLDALRVRAAQYKTRPSQAEHVAGRAGPAGARGASQLLGNRRAPGAGTAGPWNRRGGLKCTNCRA